MLSVIVKAQGETAVIVAGHFLKGTGLTGRALVNDENVIKTTVFIKNMDDFAKINAIYSEFFVENCPARSCVEVARLPKDVLLEIEAIAVK